MARPIKPFTQAQAEQLASKFWLKSRGADWHEFSKNLRVDSDEGQGSARRDLREQASFNARRAIDALQKAPTPEGVRQWIDTYLSPEGWKRVQAATRQRKHANGSGSRELLTKMSKEASWDFSYLADKAKMSKKAYLSALANWMINTQEGKRAAAMFSSTLSKNVS